MADADPKNRLNHYGSQPQSSVRGLPAALDSKQPADPKLTALSDAPIRKDTDKGQIPVYTSDSRVEFRPLGVGGIIDDATLGVMLSFAGGGNGGNSSGVSYASTLENLAAQADTDNPCFLGELGREGMFLFNADDLSAHVAADTQQAVYVAPEDDDTGASGAWVRQFQETLNVKWFGASVGATAAENYTAFQAALDFGTFNPIRDEYASNYRLLIPLDEGDYTIGGGLVVRRNMEIVGGSPHARGDGVSKLVFTSAAEAAFFFQAPGGNSAPSPYDTEIGADAYGSGRSIMRNLHIEAENPGDVDFGIVHNNPCFFDHVSVQDFRLAGFFAHGQSAGDSAFGDPNGTGGAGTMFGNTNGSLYLRCLARDTTEGHGFVAQGNNTQIMTYDTCDASGNKGCGFRDNSAIGNHYIGCHSAQNNFDVDHGGTIYICIKPHTAASTNEPGVGADWRDYWIQSSSASGDETWTLGASYRDSGGINIVDTAGNNPIIVGHYSEGGVEYGVIPRGNCTVIGGVVAGYGRIYLDHSESTSVFVHGSADKNTPARWKYTDVNGDTYGSSLGTTPTAASFFAMGHSDDDATSPQEIWKWLWSGVRFAYELTRKGVTRVLSLTATGWSLGNYSGSGNLLFPTGFILGGTSTAAIKFTAVANLAAITGSVAAGQVFWYTTVQTNGAIGAKVTTGGTVGSGAVLQEIFIGKSISVGTSAPADTGAIWIDTN